MWRGIRGATFRQAPCSKQLVAYAVELPLVSSVSNSFPIHEVLTQQPVSTDRGCLQMKGNSKVVTLYLTAGAADAIGKCCHPVALLLAARACISATTVFRLLMTTAFQTAGIVEAVTAILRAHPSHPQILIGAVAVLAQCLFCDKRSHEAWQLAEAAGTAPALRAAVAAQSEARIAQQDDVLASILQLLEAAPSSASSARQQQLLKPAESTTATPPVECSKCGKTEGPLKARSPPCESRRLVRGIALRSHLLQLGV